MRVRDALQRLYLMESVTAGCAEHCVVWKLFINHSRRTFGSVS